MRGSGGGAEPLGSALRLKRCRTAPVPYGTIAPDWILRGLAFEGGANLAAVFFKNGRTQDHEQPQCGEEGQGAENCSHHLQPPLRQNSVLLLFSPVKTRNAARPTA